MNKNIKRLWKVLMTIVVTVGMVFSYGMPVFAVDSATDDPIQTKLQQVYDEITSDDIYNAANYIFKGKPIYSILATDNTLKANKDYLDKLSA